MSYYKYQYYPNFQKNKKEGQYYANYNNKNNNYNYYNYYNNKHNNYNNYSIKDTSKCLVPVYNKNIYYNYQYNKFVNNQTQNIEQCGVILLNGSFNYPEVLLIFQKESQKWGLPKGHLNIEEKINKKYFICAIRELAEETGIIINYDNKDKDKDIYKYDEKDPRLLNNKLFYVIHILKDLIDINPIDKEEISGYAWCSLLKLNLFIKHNNCNRTIKDLQHLMMNAKN
jgi:8-oxo-dGTP pyrophosphatase MutT (NUDIX family)